MAYTVAGMEQPMTDVAIYPTISLSSHRLPSIQHTLSWLLKDRKDLHTTVDIEISLGPRLDCLGFDRLDEIRFAALDYDHHWPSITPHHFSRGIL